MEITVVWYPGSETSGCNMETLSNTTLQNILKFYSPYKFVLKQVPIHIYC